MDFGSKYLWNHTADSEEEVEEGTFVRLYDTQHIFITLIVKTKKKL